MDKQFGVVEALLVESDVGLLVAGSRGTSGHDLQAGHP